jgi:hypothetical protein
MEARISAVQQALLLLLVAALALAVLARPHPDNYRLTGALAELTTFRESFDRSAAEGLLRAQAEAQGLTPLAALTAKAEGPSVPRLNLPADAPPIRPLTSAHLATLSDVLSFGTSKAKLTLGSPDMDGLGSALAWRLARTQKSGPFVLKSVALESAELSDEDLKRESETAALRLSVVHDLAAVDAASKRLETEERILEARKTNHASWKMVLKAMDAQKEATAALEQKKAALTKTQASYESSASRAEQKPKTKAPGAVPALASARVSIEHASGPITFEIPVLVKARDVPITPLAGATFTVTRAAGLWDELKALDPDAAIAALREHFNWHNKRVELGGLEISGALALQLLPLILPLLLLLVRARARRVATSYSPFSTKVPGSLPRVGFGNRTFDALVVIVLPMLTALSAAASLLLIGRVPLLPALSTLACLALGMSAFSKLGEVQDLVQSVVHSHSYPPQEV